MKEKDPRSVPLPVGEYADQFPDTLQVSSLEAEPAPNGRDAILQLEHLTKFDIGAYEERPKVKRFVLSRPAAAHLFERLRIFLDQE